MLAIKLSTPTRLGDLLRVLEGLGVRVEGVDGMAGPHGPQTSRRLLLQRSDGAVSIAMLPNMNNGDPLTPQVARSICVQLGLDPKVLGY